MLTPPQHGISQGGDYIGDDEGSQLDRANVFFNETVKRQRYVARSVMVDLEPGPVERLMSGPLGR